MTINNVILLIVATFILVDIALRVWAHYRPKALPLVMGTGTGTGGIPNVNSRTSVPAIFGYLLMVTWQLVLVGLFIVVTRTAGVKLDNFTAGLIGFAVSQTGTMLNTAVNFFMGSSSGTKTMGDAMAESSKTSTQALTALAGAPPTKPIPTGTATDPTPVVVTNTAETPVPTTDTVAPPAATDADAAETAEEIPTHFMEKPI